MWLKKETYQLVYYVNYKIENLPRAPLVEIYNSFIRPHPDYGDILIDQTFNNTFYERLKSN